MGREYAVSELDGSRILINIVCDRCGAKIKPHPDISKSGWMVHGQDRGPGTEKVEVTYCDQCERKLM